MDNIVIIHLCNVLLLISIEEKNLFDIHFISLVQFFLIPLYFLYQDMYNMFKCLFLPGSISYISLFIIGLLITMM